MMSMGEAVGPIFGGWMVEQRGFKVASLLAMAPYLGEAALTTACRDPAVIAERFNLNNSRPAGGDLELTRR